VVKASTRQPRQRRPAGTRQPNLYLEPKWPRCLCCLTHLPTAVKRLRSLVLGLAASARLPHKRYRRAAIARVSNPR